MPADRDALVVQQRKRRNHSSEVPPMAPTIEPAKVFVEMPWAVVFPLLPLSVGAPFVELLLLLVELFLEEYLFTEEDSKNAAYD